MSSYTISKWCYHIIGFREICSTAEQTGSLFYVKKHLLTEMVLDYKKIKNEAREFHHPQVNFHLLREFFLPRENIVSLYNQCSVPGTYNTKNRNTSWEYICFSKGMKHCSSTVHCALHYVTNPAFDPVSKQPELKFCAVRIESSES